jgi:hypothetical protein
MITASPEVQEVLTDEGIGWDEFQQMVKSAAIVTHGLGNCRFHQWLFEVKGAHVTRMNHWIKEVTRYGSMDMVVHEECEHCEGSGCDHCDYVGQVRVLYRQRQRSVTNAKTTKVRRR